MGLFERLHLSYQGSYVLCRGPSRGLPFNGLMVSITFLSISPAIALSEVEGATASEFYLLSFDFRFLAFFGDAPREPASRHDFVSL